MTINFKSITSFVQDIIAKYAQDRATTLGASLAYYTVFSIAPILIIVIAVSGFFFGQEAVQGEIYAEMSGLLGAESAKQIQEIVENAYVSDKSTWAMIIGVGALLFGATGVFSELKYSLNQVWEIREKPKNSILNYLQNRLLSFSVVLGLGFILLVSLALNAIVTSFSNALARHIPGLGEAVVAVLAFLMGFMITVLMFSLLFKYLPDAKIRWKACLIGGFFTAILFSIGKYAIGLYIGNSSITTTFGSAGALAALLFWTYYSSQILFLGAEFTFVWAKHYGTNIKPDKQAVRVIIQEEVISKNAPAPERPTVETQIEEKDDV